MRSRSRSRKNRWTAWATPSWSSPRTTHCSGCGITESRTPDGCRRRSCSWPARRTARGFWPATSCGPSGPACWPLWPPPPDSGSHSASPERPKTPARMWTPERRSLWPATSWTPGFSPIPRWGMARSWTRRCWRKRWARAASSTAWTAACWSVCRSRRTAISTCFPWPEARPRSTARTAALWTSSPGRSSGRCRPMSLTRWITPPWIWCRMWRRARWSAGSSCRPAANRVRRCWARRFPPATDAPPWCLRAATQRSARTEPSW